MVNWKALVGIAVAGAVLAGVWYVGGRTEDGVRGENGELGPRPDSASEKARAALQHKLISCEEVDVPDHQSSRVDTVLWAGTEYLEMQYDDPKTGEMIDVAVRFTDEACQENENLMVIVEDALAGHRETQTAECKNVKKSLEQGVDEDDFPGGRGAKVTDEKLRKYYKDVCEDLLKEQVPEG